jgi:hypothetical protein
MQQFSVAPNVKNVFDSRHSMRRISLSDGHFFHESGITTCKFGASTVRMFDCHDPSAAFQIWRFTDIGRPTFR